MTKKEAVAAPEKAPKDIQNEVTRPGEGSSSARVWAISDRLSEEAGEPAKRADVLAAAALEEINPATTSTQYGRWRKYHGLEATPRASKAEAAAASDTTVEEVAEAA